MVRAGVLPPRWPLVACVGLSLAATACGGASASGERTTPDDAPCAAEHAALERATTALEACRATPPAPWTHDASYDALALRLDAYERSLGVGDDGDETQAQDLAAACWNFFDELAAEVVDHAPLDVAEDAAESLLRDRAHDRAVDAVAAMRAALGHLHELFAAPAAPDCTDEEADETDARATDAHCASR